MAKPNYNFEKRQREIAKKKKQDEKLARKREKNAAADGDDATGAQPGSPPDSPPGAES